MATNLTRENVNKILHQEFVFFLQSFLVVAALSLSLRAILPSQHECVRNRGTKSSNDCLIRAAILSSFPSNGLSVSRIVSLCLSACACLCTGSSALSAWCFISIRTQRLGWAAVTWSQREIEINVSEPPWALRSYSRCAMAHRVRWEMQGGAQTQTHAMDGEEGIVGRTTYCSSILGGPVLRATGEKIDGKHTGEVWWRHQSGVQEHNTTPNHFKPTKGSDGFYGVCLHLVMPFTLNMQLRPFVPTCFPQHKPGLSELKSHDVHRS